MRRLAALPLRLSTRPAPPLCLRAPRRAPLGAGQKKRVLAHPCSKSAINTVVAAGGFTLIEVLVALSIMAVMAVLAWRGIDGMVRAQQMTQAATDETLALQAGLSQWRADLDAMMIWPVAEAPSGEVPINPPPAAPAAASASPQSLLWDGRVLRITRSVAGQPAAGLRVVAWTHQAASGQWLRWQSAPVQSVQAWRSAWDSAAAWARAPAPLAPGAAGQPQAVAIARAQDWQLHYFRRNAWTNPLSASNGNSASEGAADSDSTGAPPDGIRLMLTLAEGQHFSGPLRIDWVSPNFGSAH